MKNLPDNELFSAYLDGELTADEQAQMERLLAKDPAARQLLEELRAVSQSLQSLPTQKLSEDLQERVLRIAERRMLAEETPRDEAPATTPFSKRWKNPRLWAWPAVAVVAALLLITFLPEHQAPDAARDREIAQAPKDQPAFEKEEGAELKLSEAPAEEELSATAPTIQAPHGASTREAYAEPPRAAPAKKGGVAGFDDTAYRVATDKSTTDFALSGKAGDSKKAMAERDSSGSVTLNGGSHLTPGDLPETPPPQESPAVRETKSSYSVSALTSRERTLEELEYQPRSPQDAPAGGELWVVHCAISTKALAARPFEKLLKAQGIRLVDADDANGRGLGDDFAAGPATRQLRVAGPMEAGGRPTARDETPPLEVVYVEAPANQVQSLLTALTADKKTFPTVEVTPATVTAEKHGKAYLSRFPRRQRGPSVQKAGEGLATKSRPESAGAYFDKRTEKAPQSIESRAAPLAGSSATMDSTRGVPSWGTLGKARRIRLPERSEKAMGLAKADRRVKQRGAAPQPQAKLAASAPLQVDGDRAPATFPKQLSDALKAKAPKKPPEVYIFNDGLMTGIPLKQDVGSKGEDKPSYTTQHLWLHQTLQPAPSAGKSEPTGASLATQRVLFVFRAAEPNPAAAARTETGLTAPEKDATQTPAKP